MPRKFRAICSLFLAIFALAACAPMTSKVFESNVPKGVYQQPIERYKNLNQNKDLVNISYAEMMFIKAITYYNANKSSDYLVSTLEENGFACKKIDNYISCDGNFFSIERVYSNYEWQKHVNIKITWAVSVSWKYKNGIIKPIVFGGQTSIREISE